MYSAPTSLSPTWQIKVPGHAQGMVGTRAHQQCHPEVVGEFTEGQDGYWPLV